MEHQLELENKTYILIQEVISNSVEYMAHFNIDNRFEQYQLEDLMNMTLTPREFKKVRQELELAICDHFSEIWSK